MAKLRHIGGTPVAEGVRLETGTYTVFAVRKEDKDISIRMRREPRGLLRAGLKIPLVRGIVRLFRDLYRFFDGINESTELNPQHIVRGTRPERAIASFLHVRPQTIVAWVTAICLLPIAAICLYLAPLGAEAMLRNYFTLPRASANAIICVIRIVCALSAIFVIGRLRVINRLRMYRGAINQALNCYECRDDLTVENACQYPIIARRSECAYLINVLVISMILFSLLHPAHVLLAVLYRIGIVLGVAAVINEPILALETSEITPAVRVVRAPYDLFQYMTAMEAHPQMVEVAVCAVKAALGELDREDKGA